eukprot:COSAG02_NODE_8596_length_2510_cov_2.997097_1_plen_805_part_10
MTHLEPDLMKAAINELRTQLPKSQALGYHFTNIDSARLILHSQGIRASTAGQLGGGVSVCLTSPVDLGWTKFGGATLAKRVGQALWGSKWREVMPGAAPEGGFDASAQTAQRRELVRAIYVDHAPEKLDDVEDLLRENAGREDQLLSALRDKYQVQDRYKVEDPNKDWGKHANKLEVLLVLRIPSQTSRDKTRVVPGRPDVYIIPQTDCEPGSESDAANTYFANRMIDKVFILRSPDPMMQRKQLDRMAAQPEAVRVQCRSSRDSHGGMSDVSVTEMKEAEFLNDKLIEDELDKSCCPVVASFTAIVAKPLDIANASMRAHQRIQDEHSDKQLWPENIARFSSKEMAAAVRTIDDSVPQAYTLAYYFTSADEAGELHKGSRGIAATLQPDGEFGIRVSMRSPTELGWEKNAGGNFLDTAGELMFGKYWRDTASKQLQAVLIVGVPTDKLPNEGADTFVISGALLVAGGVDNHDVTSLVGHDSSQPAPYYSSAHIYKVYLVQRTITTADHCSAMDKDQDLQDLFALVDANGDGRVTKEEATEYLRKERQVLLDDNSVSTIWSVLDEDGSGDLDITEFPRFLEVVNKEIARANADANSPGAQYSVVQAAQNIAAHLRTVAVDTAEAQMLQAAVDQMQAQLPRISLPTEAELRTELSSLKLKELKARAIQLGVDEDQLEDAEEADNAKAAMTALVVTATPVRDKTAPAIQSAKSSCFSDLPKVLGAALGVGIDTLESALDSDDAVAAVLQLLRAGAIRVESLATEADLRQELSGLRLKRLKARAKEVGIDEDQIDEAEDQENAIVAII